MSSQPLNDIKGELEAARKEKETLNDTKLLAIKAGAKQEI